MDGRPHPPAYAAHTWMGFSTGRWQGNMLVVTTTHIKKGWLRRNGVPESDLATMTEYFVRTGDVMTRISSVVDPVYLTEPLVKSEEFVLNTQDIPHRAWLLPASRWSKWCGPRARCRTTSLARIPTSRNSAPGTR